MLEKRRIAANEIGVARPEEAESMEDFRDVGTGVLDDPVFRERESHVESGCPRAHAEGVDRDPWLAAIAVGREVADEDVAFVTLLLAPNPVVRRPCRSRRFVDRRPLSHESSADAARAGRVLF